MSVSHVVAFVILATHRQPALIPSGCAPDDGLTTAFEDVVKGHIIMRPPYDWRPMTFAVADTATVRTIHDDSLCDHAMQTIRHWVVDSVYWPPAIRMVQAGNYYVAQVLSRPGGTGEFLQMYVMDRAMSTLYFPCGPVIACRKP